MLSVILLAAVISLAQYGITSRYALLILEHKATSQSLAEACVEVARIAVVNDPLYVTTNRMIVVGSATCTIERILVNTPISGQSRVEASATVSGATTNLRVDIGTALGETVQRQEVPTL